MASTTPSDMNSSGLYGDSDTESFSNELSPTDGYFNSRQNNPPDILVPDPSQNTDKAAEAEEETTQARRASESSSTQQRQSHHIPQLSYSNRRYNPDLEEEEEQSENTSLIPQSAPPTYSAAISGSSQQPPVANGEFNPGGNSRNYGTIDRVGGLSDEQPEASDGHSLPENLESKSWKKQLKRYRCASIKKIALLILAIAMIVIAIALIVEAATHIGEKHDSRKDPGHIGHPSGPSTSCPGGIYSTHKIFTFDNMANFWFIELIHQAIHVQGRQYSRVRTQGDIHIRPIEPHSQGSIRIDIDSYSSDEDLIKMLRWNQTPESLYFTTPDKITTDPASSQDPCIYLNATIWVSLGTYLTNLSIDTATMTTTFHDGLSFTANDTISVSTDVGGVLLPNSSGIIDTSLDYRHLAIWTGKGSISGICILSETVTITSRVGNIYIGIDLQGSPDIQSRAATLNLQSSDGNIKADTTALNLPHGSVRTTGIPDRVYRSIINTVNGDIWVNLVHGKDTWIDSSAGSIRARLVPYGTVPGLSTLKTRTSKGDIHLTLTPSIMPNNSPIRYLQSEHMSLLGLLDITYPTEWEGVLSGSVVSSSLEVNWSNLRIIEDSRVGGIFRRLKAFKGEGDGKFEFSSTSGAVTLMDGSTF